ncbi:MAG: amino acid adenylation domain-containing protein [Betaproteobacteria bacterium]
MGIVERFARIAVEHADAIAYRCQGRAITFAALDRDSRLLAARLAALGVGREDIVALALARDPLYAVALLGVLRAGGACMPLDPHGPRERNAAMLRTSGARVLVSVEDPGFDVDAEVVRVELRRDCDATPGGKLAPTTCEFDRHRLAFVIHTSGSSGTPKGVEISEGQVLHRLGWDWAARPWRAGDVACQHAPIGFVDAIAEWLGPLLCGVTTEIIADARLLRPQAMIDALAAARVSRIHIVPSKLDLLVEAAGELARALPALRLWTASGEPLPGALVERFRRAAPDAELWNVYGATEALGATCHRVDKMDAIVPIGRPLPGSRVYVLDEHMTPVAVGVIGDLYVAGNGLARGYHRDAALTLARFVNNPSSPGSGDRLYRTGDCARVRDDGALECLGRGDRRIKVNGVRIELGEIEAVLATHEAVREVVVVHAEGRIVAHVAVRPNIDGGVDRNVDRIPDITQLRTHAHDKLPPGALPHALVIVDALPRNAHGKVDRGRLVAPSHDVKAPCNALEAMLVEVFVEVFGRRPIGATDDFFDLGGDSLLAVRLAEAIEARTAIVFPLDVLAAARTPRAIAAGLGNHWSEWTTSRIAINPGGREAPLFAIAGAWGYAMRLLRIGRKLGSDTPFHALQPPQMQWPHDASLTTMAAHYVTEIKRVCADGPVRMLGTSFGGIMAFEVALQLQKQGIAVPLLAMVDSEPPGTEARSSPVPEGVPGAAEAVGRRMYRVHMAAARAYRPHAEYAGRVLYFRCAATRQAVLRRWQRLLVAPLEIVQVPGTHGDFHRQPQLGVIVEHLGAALRGGATTCLPACSGLALQWTSARGDAAATKPPVAVDAAATSQRAHDA